MESTPAFMDKLAAWIAQLNVELELIHFVTVVSRFISAAINIRKRYNFLLGTFLN